MRLSRICIRQKGLINMAKKLIAVIDIGSITARIKIFEVNAKGKPKEIEAVRKFTGLGSRSYSSGTIAP